MPNVVKQALRRSDFYYADLLDNTLKDTIYLHLVCVPQTVPPLARSGIGLRLSATYY